MPTTDTIAGLIQHRTDNEGTPYENTSYEVTGHYPTINDIPVALLRFAKSIGCVTVLKSETWGRPNNPNGYTWFSVSLMSSPTEEKINYSSPFSCATVFRNPRAMGQHIIDASTLYDLDELLAEASRYWG
jgi:hypothetical protein